MILWLILSISFVTLFLCIVAYLFDVHIRNMVVEMNKDEPLPPNADEVLKRLEKLQFRVSSFFFIALLFVILTASSSARNMQVAGDSMAVVGYILQAVILGLLALYFFFYYRIKYRKDSIEQRLKHLGSEDAEGKTPI